MNHLLFDVRGLRLHAVERGQGAPVLMLHGWLDHAHSFDLLAPLLPGRTIALDNQRVSRYHAQLRWVESTWLVYDLDSTNGTFVDGQRVAPSQPRVLGPKSQLRLGDYDLDVVQDVVRNDTDPAESADSAIARGTSA